MVDSVIQAGVNLEAAGSEAEIEKWRLTKVSRGRHFGIGGGDETCGRIFLNPSGSTSGGDGQAGGIPTGGCIAIAAGCDAKKSKTVTTQTERGLRTDLCSHLRLRRRATNLVAKRVERTKRYLIAAAAHNLGRILRALFGIGKPKALQAGPDLAALITDSPPQPSNRSDHDLQRPTPSGIALPGGGSLKPAVQTNRVISTGC